MTDKKETLLVMPVSGIYCEVVYGQQVYKIWKVHPNTPDKFGTTIPYDIGVYFLGKVPPVITLVPETKKGKFVSQVSEEDQKKIQENIERGFTGKVENYNQKSSISVDASDPEALKKAMDLLAQQTDANAKLQKQITEMADRLAKIEVGSTQTPQE